MCTGNTRVAMASWGDSLEVPLQTHRFQSEETLQVPVDWEEPSRILYASVRPDLDGELFEQIRLQAGCPVRVVESGAQIGSLTNVCDPPDAVGVDRLLGAFAGWKRSGGDTLIVDFGTAATYNLVQSDGTFLGGMIAPGLGLGIRALARDTSLLPEVSLSPEVSPFAVRTEEAIQAGVLWGAVGTLDRLTREAENRCGGQVQVIATGGDAQTVAAVSDRIDSVVPHLVLEGLRRLDDEMP
ncbi:MAG: type III pantothenate kinase [Planctomycetota bacterium]|nr:type III pantothenate kinase [Planctomycetota bacterium]